MKWVVALLLAALPAAAQYSGADALKETRICGEPRRAADGSIYRSSTVVSAFKRIHPCPSTGLASGACPGWNVDHVIPLASLGCDHVSNLQWLPVELKRCPGELCKDRWERRVYAP